MNIVLHEPGIALNTGNIGRTCVATHTALHLIKPYAFRISEKEIKRAGMDYWPKVELSEYLDYEDFMQRHPELTEAYTELGSDEALNAGGSSDCGTYESETSAGVSRPRLWYATTKARHCYTDVSFGPDDYIMFGNESRGIPEEILAAHPESCIRIPMWGDIRSLNLANSAAIILYEAMRQNGFDKMKKYGELHHLHW